MHLGPWARRDTLAELSAITLILLVSYLAYANAWPDVLIHDDKFFGGTERFEWLTDWTRVFREDLWAASGIRSGLYRPLLFLSLALDARLFGNWLAGYHLTNILLHGIATVLVYALMSLLLQTTATPERPTRRLYPLLAALVFAVHPVHAEVVNSIFNRSEVLVTIFATAGLWLLLKFRAGQPALAWLVLGLSYLFALFSRESGVMLPALAVALVVLLDSGTWTTRLRKCLPVLGLLAPLGFYLWLRALALAAPGTADLVPLEGMDSALDPFGTASVPSLDNLIAIAGVLGASLKLMAWPQPLITYHPFLESPWPLIYLLLHLALIVVAVVSYRRNGPGLVIGLAFFYLAFLPSARLGGLGMGLPHVAERYLYLPSVGPAIALAFGLRYLGRRFGFKMALAPALLALMLMTPLTWARNAEWASEILLFESDLLKNGRMDQLLRVLTGAHLREGNYTRVVELCDGHSYESARSTSYANHCGIAYGRSGLEEKSERAYVYAVRRPAVSATAHANLARLYLRQGRTVEAENHFQLAVDSERNPARRAYREGLMIVRLHPSDPVRLREARTHFEEALRLQPQLRSARDWIERIDDFLDRR
jgi:tetratricopeptide (TPR) repeat protein